MSKLLFERRSMPANLERRNEAVNEMERMVDGAKAEKRGLSTSEMTKFNTLKGEVENIDLSLAEQSIPSLNSNTENRRYSPQEEKEIRAWLNFVATGNSEQRDLSATGSGVVIPKSIANQIIQKIKEISPIYNLMTHYNVTGNLSVPIYDWTAHTTAFTTDFAQLTATGGSFLTADLKSYPIVSLAKIGKNLLNSTTIDIVSIIAQQIAMSMSDFIEKEIITNANAKFSGTLVAVANSTTGATVGAIDVDDLINLQMSVPSVFQPNSAFLMHPSTFSLIRKLKDTTGQPLMVNGDESIQSTLGYMLLGARIYLSENMPALATGARAIYYGDFTNGLIENTNAPLTTQILMERFADQYAIGIITATEIDVNLGNSRALGVLIGA